MDGIDSKCRNALLEMVYSDNPLEVRIRDLYNAEGKHKHPLIDVCDFRLCDLKFNDFRTYPSNGHEYGISFTKDNIPSSLFLIGRNGSGKSTIFSALEMIYCGQSSYAKESKGDDVDSYLTYGFGNSKETAEQKGWKLKYKFAGEKEYRTIDKDHIQAFVPPCFLCYESEIEKSREYNGLFKWILQQLGYGKLLIIKDAIDNLKRQNEEQTKLLSSNNLYSNEDLKQLVNVILNNHIDNRIRKEITTYCNYDNINEQAVYSLFSSLWQSLYSVESSEGEMINTKTGNVNNDNEEIKKHIAKLYTKLLSIIIKHQKDETWGYDDVKSLILEIENDNGMNVDANSKELETYSQLLDDMRKFTTKFCTELVSEFITQNATEIEEIMRMFSSHEENYKFVNTAKETIRDLEMQISVKTKREFTTSPLEYLNTFRYRLYFVTLKLALSFKWMELTGISSPVVIDDVFNASDFDNSVKLESYIYNLKKIYDHICIEKGFNKPLQLIILTHDDMVHNSVKNGFCSYHAGDNEKLMSERIFPAICARLYKLEELSFIKNGKSVDYKNVYL